MPGLPAMRWGAVGGRPWVGAVGGHHRTVVQGTCQHPVRHPATQQRTSHSVSSTQGTSHPAGQTALSSATTAALCNNVSVPAP
ncbi:MAG TPA: hypothetical protein VLA25_04350 [Methylotenera sp.]|nr:hypothetical protein [Methylotenera sp.]